MVKKSDNILYEALIEKAMISKERLDSCLKEAGVSEQNLAQILVNNGLLSERDILAVLSEKLKLTYLDLKNISIEKSVLDKVPIKVASYYKFVPISIKNRVMTIAVSVPLDIKIQDEIRTQVGYDIETVLSTQNDIAECLKKYYGSGADTLEKMVSQTPRQETYEAQDGHEKLEDIEKLAGDASVIKLVNQIILEAYRKRATDIHIEPYREGVSLRYRIDGLLYDANIPPEIKSFVNAIISRIKIMSNLNIVERRLPQDGRAVVKVQDKVLDLRISTIPTHYGESVVIRILPTQMLFSLEKLGLAKVDMKVFEKLLQKPHGVIFVTGPTGSGKTTTLYTCLSKINTKDRKIITIEDPIEYEMDGITQIQVISEIGLDFARGLRSILRHDPDIIMVGEVRDLETAEIAIRVALTGHLVFSTVHTNDAVSGITRLIDIGVEPYLISSSVEAFIAQRLIRVICNDCRYEDKTIPPELKDMIIGELGVKPKDIKIFKGKGCVNCNHTGFWGRTAIYEILVLDDLMKDMILKKASSGQMKSVAISRGMRTLRQDGWQKVIAGVTTPEEVLNVTSSEEGDMDNKEQFSYSGPPEEAVLEPPGSDRRAYSRLNRKINIRYKVFKSREELLKKGFSPEQLSVAKNISGGGLLFVSDEALAVGSFLELNIELPDGEKSIECLSRVVRVEEIEEHGKYDIAVCFLDITGSERSRLNKYVETEKR
jgi:type II secretory ATPase GspE/PulE/Tfp pilus assembly ATPase PilB-like protein